MADCVPRTAVLAKQGVQKALIPVFYTKFVFGQRRQPHKRDAHRLQVRIGPGDLALPGITDLHLNLSIQCEKVI